MTQVKYEEIRSELNTGDIVLFAGSNIFSRAIMLATKSKWSHVGMVFKFPGEKMVLLWEASPPVKLKDAVDGKIKNGVKMLFLSEKIEQYPEVAIRQLKGTSVVGDKYEKLMSFRELVRHRNFDFDIIELFKASYDGGLWADNTEDLSSLFCSELVAKAYQEMGLLGESLPANEFTPRNFSEKGDIDLLDGASLGPEIQLV